MKGIAIPRELIEIKLLTADDILVKYEEEVERLMVRKGLEPTEDAVAEYLVERGVAEETAHYVYRLLRADKPPALLKKVTRPRHSVTWLHAFLYLETAFFHHQKPPFSR